MPPCYRWQTTLLRGGGRSEGDSSAIIPEVTVAANRANPIDRTLDGEMRVPRVTGPIVGALAVAVVLLAIVLFFQAL